jgi:nicotinate phosphoribosyltransferase
LQVRRFCQPDGGFIADAIYEIDHGINEQCLVVDVETREETQIPAKTDYSDLLVPIFRKGQLLCEAPNIEAARERARQQLSSLPPEVVRLDNPRAYPVGLEKSLHDLRSTLIAQARKPRRE